MIRRYRTVDLLFVLILLSVGRQQISAQVYVTPAQTAQALAQKLAGQGVTISNYTLTCASQANGIFSVTSSNLGLDSGIVLTNGRAATQGSLIGVNGLSADFANTDNGMPGDTLLDPLAGQPTVDACSLEFDVVPFGDTIKFDYVFSSEEYKSAVCWTYNDAFGFFISGPGISGNENMALVPGTNIPVTINTINNGIPGAQGKLSICTSMGAGSPFTGYYVDNSFGTTITHLGLTKMLQAIHAVTPCQKYHLKLVIADAGDPLYDSGVFLKAGSLQTGNFNIQAVATLPTADTAYCIKGCLPGVFRVRRTISSNGTQTVKFIKGGTAVSGVDYIPFADSVVIPANTSSADVFVYGLPTPPLGTKEIRLYVLAPYNCSGVSNIVDSASLPIYDTMTITTSPRDTVVCGNENVQLQANGSDLFTYNWSPATGLSNPGIKNPVLTTGSITTYTVTASIPGTSCTDKTAEVNLTLKLTPNVLTHTDTNVCFNTEMQLQCNTADSNLFYRYQWSGPNGFSSSLQNPVINKAEAQNSGLYAVSVIIDTNNCRDAGSIDLIVNTPDTPGVKTSQVVCFNSQPEALSATGDNLLWYSASGDTSSVAPVPPSAQLANYIYYVTQTIGRCESNKSEINVEVKKCCDGNIFIPTAFTPNGDGLNDKFETIEDYGYYINSMFIYNRWGQLMYSGTRGVWDGNYGGSAAEMGTYFYNISFGCILGGTVVKKGDVTLIR